MTNETRICDICRIGRCQSLKAPYLYWVDDQVLVMPDSPAWACDICTQVYFESAFLVRIERLLQEMERSVENRRITKQIMPREELVTWSPSRAER